MCGIAGFFATDGVPTGALLEAVRRMTRQMQSRGPDAEGEFAGDRIVLGHRRLAIVDLDPRANQPMQSADGRHVIIFNGEIYNFRELRRMLEGDGVVFRTTSDTEVLLTLYAREREDMLRRLRGMFAFAIWDTLTGELFLARDPYGIKPLYYSQTGEGLIFASQVKAVLASGRVPAEREAAGLVGFYLWGNVPEPWTLFRGVFALPAGHWLRSRDGVASAPVSWHDIRMHWHDETCTQTDEQLHERVRQAVSDSVSAHLVSDVPVCVFLSGGIDSAAVAGLASELGARIECITIGFEEFAGRRDDETCVAHTIAEHCGLPHQVRMVSRAEFLEDLSVILDAMDQPSVDGINTWFASKAAAERGYKVALSGVGGDELFHGYASFWQVPRMAAIGRTLAAIPGARALFDAPCTALAARWSKPKLAGVPRFMDSLEGAYFLRRCLFLPAELPSLVGEEMAREGLASLRGGVSEAVGPAPRDAAARVAMLESTLYLRNQLLRDSDWASMGHSVELRTPLVDIRLLASLGPCDAGFAGGSGKALLAQSLKKPLPAAIVKRPKTGFSVPMSEWLLEGFPTARGKEVTVVPSVEPATGWARRWARTVAEQLAGCE
jgi:asparagine synthase (glutamine-hydrolysing)